MAAPGQSGNPAPAGRSSAWPRAVIVAGPTCSGKSALALALAQRLGGEIINADSMQIYRELRVVTARPTPEEEALVPHALYGVRMAAEAGSAGWWRGEAIAAMNRARDAGRLPILCGGTGLYFTALTQGLADIPDPGVAARQEARALLLAIGPESLHARLAAQDPRTAARLRPTDGQRLARAWEVLQGTGRGLASWQDEAPAHAETGAYKVILIDPPRDALRAAIATRFAAMIHNGAIEEVQALLALGLDPALPAMRAHGVPELAAFLRGEISLARAAERACLVTGQYTKRQATWFRNRNVAPGSATKNIIARIECLEQFSGEWMADMQNFIFSAVDAPQHGP